MASLKKWLLIAALLIFLVPNISHVCLSQMRLIPLDEFCEDVFQRNPGKLSMYSSWEEIKQKGQGTCVYGDPRMAMDSWAYQMLIRLSQIFGDRWYSVRIRARPSPGQYIEAWHPYDQCKVPINRRTR